MTRPAAEQYLGQLGASWSLTDDGQAITRTITFRSFRRAMRFVNTLADLAEAEQHHPNFCVSYKQVILTISTYAIGGLSANDFILAARTNQLLRDLRTGD